MSELTVGEALALAGTAPGTKWRQVGEFEGGACYLIVLRDGDEVVAALKNFVQDVKVGSGSLTAIGAVRQTQLGYYDEPRRRYLVHEFTEPHEVTNLSGTFGISENGPVVHLHATIAGRDGRASGGHVLSSTASPTLEVYATVYAVEVHKAPDEASGLTLYQLD